MVNIIIPTYYNYFNATLSFKPEMPLLILIGYR